MIYEADGSVNLAELEVALSETVIIPWGKSFFGSPDLVTGFC